MSARKRKATAQRVIHPYEKLRLRVGSVVLVPVRVTKLFPRATLGWAHAWVEGAIDTYGLIGENRVTIPASMIRKVEKK